MNVYDAAHNLSKAIRENSEYKRFSALNKKIMNDDNIKDKVKIFKEKEDILQRSQLKGDNLNKELLKEVEEIYSELYENEIMQEYFDLEIKINQMMSDITKILKEAIDIEY